MARLIVRECLLSCGSLPGLRVFLINGRVPSSISSDTGSGRVFFWIAVMP
jgi:hypothetical protein